MITISGEASPGLVIRCVSNTRPNIAAVFSLLDSAAARGTTRRYQPQHPNECVGIT